MDNTKIEWTDATWNPLRGCSRVSEGCRHCYAEGVAARFSKPGQAYEGLAKMVSGEPRWTGDVRLIERALEQPLRWQRPRRIFVNSMSDLFHEKVLDSDIDRIFRVMHAAKHHTFQILTKRPQRMLEYMSRRWVQNHEKEVWRPLPNVWVGVSVENQAAADERIPLLLKTPAAVRWISAEPLLGPIRLDEWAYLPSPVRGDWPVGHELEAPAGLHLISRNEHGAASVAVKGCRLLGLKPHEFELRKLDWVVVGFESGRGARPGHPAWARSLRDQCVAAGIPFFFKQWGDFGPLEDKPEPGDGMFYVVPHDGKGPPLGIACGYGSQRRGMLEPDWKEKGGACMYRFGKAKAGRVLDGRTWDEYPEAA